MRYRYIHLTALAAMSVFASCGYYSLSGSAVPGSIKSIAIPLLNDETSEFGIREKITDELIDKFTEENILQIKDTKSSDSVLEGTIKKVTDRAETYDESENVLQYKVSIFVDIVWYDKKQKKNLFEGKVTGWGLYPAESPEQREQGIEKAIERLVTEIMNQTLSGW